MSFAYDDDESNPFADPSVRQHTQFTPNTQPTDFNYGGTARQVPTQSASQATSAAPPAYQEQTPKINNEDLLRRQEELDRKAAELQRKEQVWKCLKIHFYKYYLSDLVFTNTDFHSIRSFVNARASYNFSLNYKKLHLNIFYVDLT